MNRKFEVFIDFSFWLYLLVGGSQFRILENVIRILQNATAYLLAIHSWADLLNTSNQESEQMNWWSLDADGASLRLCYLDREVR